MTTTISSAYANLTTAPTWQIGLLQSSTVTAAEADPRIAPVTRQMVYGYDSNGLLRASAREYLDPATNTFIQASETLLTRDNYGLVTQVSTTAPGPNPDSQYVTRQVNIEYDPLWSTPQQAQPDERVFPSQVWQPFAPSSYAPSVWTLVHPAYGVVMASMDVNGHQVTSNYDDLGRPRTVWPDDAATQTLPELPGSG